MIEKNFFPKFMTVFGVIALVSFFSACTKTPTDKGHSATTKENPRPGSDSLLQKKAKNGFVPYENRPPFGTPVETH